MASGEAEFVCCRSANKEKNDFASEGRKRCESFKGVQALAEAKYPLQALERVERQEGRSGVTGLGKVRATAGADDLSSPS